MQTFQCTWNEGSSSLFWSYVVRLLLTFYILDFSKTDEETEMKLYRKQLLNVLYLACVLSVD